MAGHRSGQRVIRTCLQGQGPVLVFYCVAATMITIGVLSDTHLIDPDKRFREKVERCFADADIILHAGDLTSLAVLFLLALYLFSLNGQDGGESSISVQQVLEKPKEDSSLLLLDVRTGPEFTGALGHLPGAILIPLAELGERKNELEKYRENQIIVVCRSGNRSGQATKILRAEGFNALNMTGGMLAWNKMMETMQNDSSSVKDKKSVER